MSTKVCKFFPLSELRRAAKACDVIDPIANPNAITIFYSGGENIIASKLASSGGENIIASKLASNGGELVRILDRTDRAKLLSYADESVDGHSFKEWVESAIV